MRVLAACAHLQRCAALLALALLVPARAQTDSSTVADLQSILQTSPIVQGGGDCCPQGASDTEAVLTARPESAGTPNATATGLFPLGLSEGSRDGYLYVPPTYVAGTGLPLIVTLHAAQKNGLDGLALLYPFAASAGVILLAPESRLADWDLIICDSFGPDISFINAALQAVFARYSVQSSSIGMQGFSDGATYALTLGLVNGDLFSKIIALSPAGAFAPSTAGQPSVFVSGGTSDQIFPIAQGPRAAACDLVSGGYQVAYVEFDGAHDVPSDVASRAMQWFLGQTQIGGPSPSLCSDR